MQEDLLALMRVEGSACAIFLFFFCFFPLVRMHVLLWFTHCRTLAVWRKGIAG